MFDIPVFLTWFDGSWPVCNAWLSHAPFIRGTFTTFQEAGAASTGSAHQFRPEKKKRKKTWKNTPT